MCIRDRTCSNGRDALLVAREYNPDLILSDVMRPEMGGDELCAAVKSDIETSHIPDVYKRQMIISCDFGFRQRVGKCILLSGFLGFCLFSGKSGFFLSLIHI